MEEYCTEQFGTLLRLEATSVFQICNSKIGIPTYVHNQFSYVYNLSPITPKIPPPKNTPIMNNVRRSSPIHILSQTISN